MPDIKLCIAMRRLFFNKNSSAEGYGFLFLLAYEQAIVKLARIPHISYDKQP